MRIFPKVVVVSDKEFKRMLLEAFPNLPNYENDWADALYDNNVIFLSETSLCSFTKLKKQVSYNFRNILHELVHHFLHKLGFHNKVHEWFDKYSWF